MHKPFHNKSRITAANSLHTLPCTVLESAKSGQIFILFMTKIHFDDLSEADKQMTLANRDKKVY